MLEVKVHNDGKGKYQSYEAWVNGVDCNKGYGSTEQEAIDDYFKEIKKEILRLTKIKADILVGDIKIVNVDCLGKEV